MSPSAGRRRKVKKIAVWCFAAILLILLPVLAGADTAQEIKSGVTFEANGKAKNVEEMRDDDFGTYFPLKEKNGWLEIHSEEEIHGVSVMLFDKFSQPLSYELQIRDVSGEWVTTDKSAEDYLVQWHELEKGTKELRILATSRERLRIAELRLFGEGEKPAEIQHWKTLGKCDMMLLTAHPDDETLWFAGLLPTYAGERKLRVQPVVMVPTGGERKLEVLSAFWTCGVTAYPEFLGLVDKNGKSVEKQYKVWRGQNRVLGLVTEVIRKHQPEVLVTHGERGEYGHGAHKTACDAAKLSVKYAAKESRFKESAKKYGTWQVKKLYLHEYDKNVIPCDWSVPLEAFGGKTGYEVAAEAFAWHRSQIKRDWEYEIHGKHDNAAFGLYFTTVGQDTGTGDFMEHIELENSGTESAAEPAGASGTDTGKNPGEDEAGTAEEDETYEEDGSEE